MINDFEYDPTASATITHSNLAAGGPWMTGTTAQPWGNGATVIGPDTAAQSCYFPLNPTWMNQPVPIHPVPQYMLSVSGEQIMSAKLITASLEDIRAIVRDEVRKALQDEVKHAKF